MDIDKFKIVLEKLAEHLKTSLQVINDKIGACEPLREDERTLLCLFLEAVMGK